ncbi:MAG: GxxExxY protein [Chloroflexi bacterium]|nr:GxxExxY protein [Chloroflexota bacterium]
MNHTVTRDYTDNQYPLSALTARIIAAAQQVYHTLGPGFEEVIYQRALALELPAHQVDFAREVWIEVMYKDRNIGRKRVDFIAGDSTGNVMVEIKAKSELEDVFFIQTLSYLKASGYRVGLLINFGSAKLQVKRLAN